MPFRHHTLPLLFLLFASLSCRTTQPRDSNIFCYNQLDGIESLDPAFAKSLSVMWAVKFMYNTLVEVDTNLNVVPSLAKSWEISPDGLSYTFHLRQDVHFHDNPVFSGGKGRRMTAQDVAYSFRRLIDPNTASAGAWIFNGRVADKNPFEALNDSTFILRLSSPFRPLPEILSMPYCAIVPKEAVEKWGTDFRSHPCGTGPFRFAFWDEGNVLMFHRNPDYWETDAGGQQLPYLDGIRVSFNETRAMEFLRFQQDELDFMNGIDGSMQDLVLSKNGKLRPRFQDKIRLSKKTYLNTEYLGIVIDSSGWEEGANPLRLRKVRQAINYAIDRRKLITYFRNGIGTPAKGGFIPAGMPGSYVSQELQEAEPQQVQTPARVGGYEHNPAKALQLLAEAGFPNGKGLPLITLQTPDANVDICNFVSSQLREVGIPVQVQVMQKGLLRQQMSRSALPFFKANWIADYPDAESFLAFFYSEFPAPPNYTRFNNPQFDQWYRASLRATNDSLRFALYAQMDSLVSSYAPVVPLFYDEIMHFTQPHISGLRSNALNMIDLRYVQKQ